MAGHFVSAPIASLPLLAFEDRISACAATASALAHGVMTAHRQGRRARIALSGGSSPAPAYQAFAAMDLDWSRVDVGLVDERWVDIDHQGSNEAMIRHALRAAQGVTIFGMKTPHAMPLEAEPTLDPIYQNLRPFDVVVMGMGPDAHTASWFPGSPQLTNCLDIDASATMLGVDASAAPVAGDYPWRMTMTLPPVAEAAHIVFLLFGADKKEVLHTAINTPVTQAPIRAVLEASLERCVVFWAN